MKTPEAQPPAAGPGPGSFFPDTEKAEPAAGSSADPFSALDQAKAKEDFENAFASFKSASKASPSVPETTSSDAPKGFSAFNAEFPPISELENDDESDSDDDKGGFDDDFAPASPHAKPADQPESPSLNKVMAGDTTAPTAGEDVEQAKADADDLFGSAPPPGSFPEPEVPAATATPTATQGTISKQSSAFDDLDDDFADLEDAKEGSQDDDFQTISRSGLDDFNPTFDSPPPAGKTDAARPTSSSGAAPFSTESTFDFASIDNTASQPATEPAEGAKGSAPADNHDWDAIFADLDSAPPAETAASPPPPGSSGGPAPDAPSTNNNLLARPEAPGRALTEEGAHDDPILKNLTSMGYSRSDALSALEKYDYNLERVS